jgi:hypothetical protein
MLSRPQWPRPSPAVFQKTGLVKLSSRRAGMHGGLFHLAGENMATQAIENMATQAIMPLPGGGKIESRLNGLPLAREA